jgi:hypothetical protein
VFVVDSSFSKVISPQSYVMTRPLTPHVFVLEDQSSLSYRDKNRLERHLNKKLTCRKPSVTCFPVMHTNSYRIVRFPKKI